MDRDPDLYRRSEFGWFLGALAFGMSVASALPVAWWAKLGLGLISALALLPVLGWLLRPLGRILRFLLVPVLPLPTQGIRASGRLVWVWWPGGQPAMAVSMRTTQQRPEW